MRSVVNEIIHRVSKRRQQKRNREFLHDFLDEVRAETWRKGRLVIPDFVIFTVKKTKARSIHNPQSHEQIHLPACKTVKARVANLWRTR